MPKCEINFEEVLEYVKTLPYSKFKEIVSNYSTSNKLNADSELVSFVISDLQLKLKSIGINSKCPKCDSSHIKKYGKRNNIQTYKCYDCNTKFTLFTNTLLEKTHWHWDIWVRVLEMTINNYSYPAMINVLEADYSCSGINYKTVWLWRLKLIHDLASISMPNLKGVIQVDETFVRESQKGSRKLISYVGKYDKRKPIYGRRPSKPGVMGPEFATITTAIDNRGYSVCKLSSLGKLTADMFIDQFHHHFDNPAYICSDANDVYESYCELYNIPHYEKPTNYIKTIEKFGYITPDYSASDVQDTINRNEKILENYSQNS